MTTTLVPDTGTDRHAIARGLIEVDVLDHEAGLWRELADFLAEPLALHNLLAEAAGQPVPEPLALHNLLEEARATWVPAVPFHHRDAALDTLGARVRASIEPEPEPEHVLADVAPRRGGEHRRKDRPGWLQRLRDAWADETGDRDEIGAPA